MHHVVTLCERPGPYHLRVIRRSFNSFLAKTANNGLPWARLYMACHLFIHNHGSTPIWACIQCFWTCCPMCLQRWMTSDKQDHTLHAKLYLTLIYSSIYEMLYLAYEILYLMGLLHKYNYYQERWNGPDVDIITLPPCHMLLWSLHLLHTPPLFEHRVYSTLYADFTHAACLNSLS